MTITVEEAFFYNMAADIEVLRLVLVAQFARLGEVQPESLLELKDSILDPLDRNGDDPALEQNARRFWILTLERAKKFFADVERAQGALRTAAIASALAESSPATTR